MKNAQIDIAILLSSHCSPWNKNEYIRTEKKSALGLRIKHSLICMPSKELLQSEKQLVTDAKMQNKKNCCRSIVTVKSWTTIV